MKLSKCFDRGIASSMRRQFNENATKCMKMVLSLASNKQ